MDIAYYLEAPLKIGLTILGLAVFLALSFLGLLGRQGINSNLPPRVGDVPKVWKIYKNDYKNPNIVLGGPIGIVLLLVRIGVSLTIIGLITWGIKLILY